MTNLWLNRSANPNPTATVLMKYNYGGGTRWVRPDEVDLYSQNGWSVDRTDPTRGS